MERLFYLATTTTTTTKVDVVENYEVATIFKTRKANIPSCEHNDKDNIQ
jgi:hypothetical protein